MSSAGRPSNEEIAAKRAERAQKKLEAEAAEAAGDDAFNGGEISYTFKNHVISIVEDWSGEGSALAGMQWLGGVTLARMFDEFPPASLKEKNVIEFGAGCGLTSILLALLGANVTLTDLDVDKAIPNIAANITNEEVRSRIHVATLDWLSPELDRFTLPFDIIVAGDCCYDTQVIDPLMKTMWNSSSKSTQIYLCGIVSELALVAFNEVVWKYFDVERLDESSASKGADSLSRPPLNSDDPKTRLRALMRLHRKDSICLEESPSSLTPLPPGSLDPPAPPQQLESAAIPSRGKRSVGESVLHGPTLLGGGSLEVHVCQCPRLLMRELAHVFPELPKGPVLALPTSQHSAMDLVRVGGEVEVEKDRCLEEFVAFARDLCLSLRAKGFWADYIDPCSGLPVLTPNTTKTYSEVDGFQALLGYATMDAGMCKILLHPKWGSAVYPASAFTDAPLEAVTAVLAIEDSAEANAGSADSNHPAPTPGMAASTC